MIANEQLRVEGSMMASVTATQSINYRSSSLNFSPKFKRSVKRAIRHHMRRYNQSLDPSVCKEVELSVSDAVDLAVRIIKRSHCQQVSTWSAHILWLSHMNIRLTWALSPKNLAPSIFMTF